MAKYVSHEKLDAEIEERNKTDEKTLLLQSTSKGYGGTTNGETKEIKAKAKSKLLSLYTNEFGVLCRKSWR